MAYHRSADFRTAVNTICDADETTGRGMFDISIVVDPDEYDRESMQAIANAADLPLHAPVMYTVNGGGEAVIGRIVEFYNTRGDAIATYYETAI